MLRIGTLIAVAMFLMLPSKLPAQSYQGDDVPDAIVFQLIVIYFEAIEYESAVQQLMNALDTDWPTATEVYGRILLAKAHAERDEQNAHRMTLCSDLDGKAKMQKMYDDTAEAYNEQYLQLLDDIDPELSEKLDRWVDKRKSGTIHTRIQGTVTAKDLGVTCY